MSFNILLLCGAVIGALFLLLPVKELKNSYFSIAVIALSVLVTASALKAVTPVLTYLGTFYDSAVTEYFKVLIKVLGITVICSITSDLAAELGVSTLSGKVEFAGKVAVILSAMPIFDSLFSEIGRLI